MQWKSTFLPKNCRKRAKNAKRNHRKKQGKTLVKMNKMKKNWSKKDKNDDKIKEKIIGKNQEKGA